MNVAPESLFQTIFNQLPEPRILVKADSPRFTVLFCNDCYRSATQTTPEELAGLSIFDLPIYAPEESHSARSLQALQQVVESALSVKSEPFQYKLRPAFEPCTTDNTACYSTGIAFWYQHEYLPLFDDEGIVCGILERLHNVSNEVNLLEGFERARIRNKALNKEAFLNISLTRQNEELSGKNKGLLNSNRDLHKINLDLNDTNKNLNLSQLRMLGQNKELEASLVSHSLSLHESEYRFRELFEHAPLGMTLLRGADLIIELANISILKIWGRTLEEVIGKTQKEARPELQGQQILANLTRVFETGKAMQLSESRAFVLKDGIRTEGYFDMLYQPFKDADGKTTSMLVVLTEVTDKVLARKNAEKTLDTLKMAIYAGGLGTWRVKLETGEIYASDHAQKIYGNELDVPMNLELSFSLMDVLDRDTVIAAMDKAIKTGESFTVDYRVNPLDGGPLKWINAMGKVEMDENGKPNYISGTILDITERKLDDLRKNDFITMVSHELKTPLTSLRGFAELATARSTGIEDPFISYALDKINLQARKMTEMINSFLNISRLEAGKIQLYETSFVIGELISETVRELAVTTDSHIFTIAPSPAITLLADQDKIAQVITNLLTNAVKYSPRGTEIEIACTLTGGLVRVSVRDNGIGIKLEDHEKLFDRFYRVESPETENISGFGIGLYLCAEILRRHKGHIGVLSKPGKGSTFYFTLPAGAEAEPQSLLMTKAW